MFEYFRRDTTARTEHLSPGSAAQFLAETADAIVLDVREPWEYRHCHLKDAVHIPLGVLPVRVGELDRSRPVLVYCHHGSRSVFACNILVKAGFPKVYNLKGGIDLWAKTVDASIKLY